MPPDNRQATVSRETSDTALQKNHVAANARLPTTKQGKKQQKTIKDIIVISKDIAEKGPSNKKEMEKLTAEKNNLELQLNKEHEKHVNRCEELGEMRQKLQQRHDQLLKKNKELKKKNEELLKEKKSLKNDISEKENKLNKSQENVETMRKKGKLNATKKKEREMEETRNMEKTKKNRTSPKIEDDSDVMKKLENEVEALKQDIVILDGELEQAKVEVEKLQRAAKAKK